MPRRKKSDIEAEKEKLEEVKNDTDKTLEKLSISQRIELLIDAKKFYYAPPLTTLLIADMVGITISEYQTWREKNQETELLKKLDHLIYHSLYNWGFSEKIKSPVVLDIYIKNELPIRDEATDLKVINDLNNIQKVAGEFTINNPVDGVLEIENPNDEITVIKTKKELSDEELEELVEEVEDA